MFDLSLSDNNWTICVWTDEDNLVLTHAGSFPNLDMQEEGTSDCPELRSILCSWHSADLCQCNHLTSQLYSPDVKQD